MRLGRYSIQFATQLVMAMAIVLLSGSGNLVRGQESAPLSETEAQELQRLRAQEGFRENLERAIANSASLRDRIDDQIENAMAAQRPAITAIFVVLALLPLLGAIAVWLILNRLEARANAYAQEIDSIKNDAMAELLGMMNEAHSVLHQIQTQIHEPLPRVPVGAERQITTSSPARDPLSKEEENDLEMLRDDSPSPNHQASQDVLMDSTDDSADNIEEDEEEEPPPSLNSILNSEEDEEEEPPPSLNSILDSEEDEEEDDRPNQTTPLSVNSILDQDSEEDEEETSQPPPVAPETAVQPPITYRGGNEGIATASENRLNGNTQSYRIPEPEPVRQPERPQRPPQPPQVGAAEFCRQANALFFSGRYSEAIAAYQQAVQLKPDYHQAWSNQGSALFHLQRYPEAIAAYDRALSIYPDYPEAWNNKGGALSKLGQYKEALAAYDRAVELKPDYVEAWNNRGLALMELKRYKESVASYNRAVKLKPDYVEAWNNRGLAFAGADLHEQALRCFDKARSLNPDNIDTYRNQGLSLAALERYPEAIRSYQRGTEIQPNDIPTWYYLGQLLTQLERYDEAIAAYNQAIALQPAIPEIWYNKAGCYSAQGFVAPCLESLQEALRLAPHPYRERAQVDPVFDEIRQDERFKQLLL
ncbi:tetratricopeptide repeat protein [Geitlerinema sp. P-1104]|uniref:tetratricopeptide repeat protein n=1 Tax=Geitlerinema sp. P-1104 TaxID=2546230 RepID=UPI0014770D0C|nr:tetratricopeptide repeat protein [Geitlerinema sp. P-1104]NMG57021.1 tetratricopeptide repeat protein [Geitlerinema sp. P-1104]